MNKTWAEFLMSCFLPFYLVNSWKIHNFASENK